MRTPLAEELGLDVPIFAFSKAPAVVAAVSRAGGMGVLGAVAYTVDQLREALDFIDAHVDGKPYGVDVVMPAKVIGKGEGGTLDPTKLDAMISPRHRAFIEDLLARHEVPPLPEGEHSWHTLLAWTEQTTRPQVDLVLERADRGIKLLANALGTPPVDIIERAHAKGVKVAALTGAVDHAVKHVASGVDILIAQGTEAGGHCGEIATMVLVPEVVDAVGATPVLAAGGIGCGRQVAAALALGAAGAWTGSIWLTAEESDVTPLLKDKLLQARSSDTVRSRALTGKPARQLRTAWSEAWDDPQGPGALPMPLQFMATADATSRIFRYAGQPGTRAHELLTSPVGQIVGRMNESRPVAEIMERLVTETRAAIARISALSSLR